ncbi:MAG: hypothetical protein MJB14_15860, partial [Spirochaetes bacterium]|nr:hypothetical protein [Spirochaetota bacterium]
AEKSELELANFHQGKIIKRSKLPLNQDFQFIGKPDFSPDGTQLVFHARSNTQQAIYLYDLETEQLQLVPSIKGYSPKFIDQQQISYISQKDILDCLAVYQLEEEQVKTAVAGNQIILNGLIVRDQAIYVEYTRTGEEIFTQKTEAPHNHLPVFSAEETAEEPIPQLAGLPDLQEKNYLPLAYLYPQSWALIPYQLNSSLYLVGQSTFEVPLFGPGYLIYHKLPLGRMEYQLNIAYDYMKNYPENSLQLQWNLLPITIQYSWHNYADGYKYRVYSLADRQWGILEYRFPKRYPIGFRQSFLISGDFPLFGKGNLGFSYQVGHSFSEWDFSLGKLTNQIYFTEKLYYYHISRQVKSSRWDKGFYSSLTFYQSPALILDNSDYYLFRLLTEWRVPVKQAIWYAQIEGGVELFWQNVFNLSSSQLSFQQSLLDNSSSGLSEVDIKSLSRFFLSNVYSAASFAATEWGFYIPLYKKSHYWRFASLGFRELTLKPFVETCYFYQTGAEQPHNFLIDGVLEISIDLFAVYGNISLRMTNGVAVGYLTQAQYPLFSFYFNFQVGL